jgi:hypothetical protein
MRCKHCNGNIIRDAWNHERCLQCGREVNKGFVYKKRSYDSRKKLQGGKFPQ